MNNRKKLYLLLGGTVLAVLIAVGAFFLLRGASDTYAEVIPQDATAIARLDATALVREADLSLPELLRMCSADSADATASSPGIDLTRPVYGFASPSGYFGLVAAVADKDAFAAFLASPAAEGHASEVTQQRGFSWAVVEQQWLLAFNGSKALLMGPAVGAAQESLRAEMVRLMEQGTKESGKNSPLFVQLRKSDEPLAAILTPELLPAEAREALTLAGLPSTADALLRLTVDLDDNEVELEASVLTDDTDVRASLKAADDLLRPLKADLLDYTHEGAAAWMALNLKGDDLLPLLRHNEQLRLALVAINLVVDADLILRSIDGDVALELSDVSASTLTGGALPTAQLTARLSNTDFLKNASTWGSPSLMPVRALSANDFAVSMGSQPLYFGAHDKVFYLGTMPVLSETRKGETNAYLRDHRKDIRGLRFYAQFDLQASQASSAFLQHEASGVLRQFERLTVEMKQAGRLRLTLSAPEGTHIARALLRP